MEFIEAALTAIKDKLTENWEASTHLGGTMLDEKIIEINTEMDDDITVERILSDSMYLGKRPFEWLHSRPFPCLCFVPISSPGEWTSVESINAKHQINIEIYVNDDKFDDLESIIWRYQRAITEVLFESWTLDNDIDQIFFGGHFYDPERVFLLNNVYYNYGGVQVMIDKEIGV